MPPIVAAVRDFVEQEVRPAASALEHADSYPHALVDRMKQLGLFGCLIPADFGGLGLDVATYARVIEELCRGWMSLAGVINSHTMMALIVLNHGTDEQRRRFLPSFAGGERRGGLGLTEPHAGSDVQAIRTVARRHGDRYVINGTKMFITNGREGNTFALLARTDPRATPAHKGMSCFIVEKGAPGFRVVKSIGKLGYKGVDTVELLFEDVAVPAANLVGGVEGRGFKHVMAGLETGRINIAARAVGVARAALEETLDAARGEFLDGAARGEPPDSAPRLRLADMATSVVTARLLTYWAAGMKDRGERCDLEAGIAKLYATEAAQEVAAAALRVRGEAGQLATAVIERHYRDTPLMIIGEGTNEIQRLLIARQLLERYGERTGALLSREGEPDERRQIVLAVRQFVEKQALPSAPGPAQAGYPAEIVEQLAELGIFGATAAPEDGGLGLDLTTVAMIVEELARGSTAVAGIVTGHLVAMAAIARFGAVEQRRLLPRMTRGEILGTGALTATVDTVPDGRGWRLSGTVPLLDNARRAGIVLLPVRLPGERTVCVVIAADSLGVRVGAPADTLGARGLEPCSLQLDGVRVGLADLLGAEGAGDGPVAYVGGAARVLLAATAVGLAQAAFEAALRYSQQRSAFGKPICQHQAIQLKLADMATAITAARLLTSDAAGRQESDPHDLHAQLARTFASEVACTVTLESMRIHGGYGYTTEFPVERYYRDAPRLALALGGNDRERLEIARRLLRDEVSALLPDEVSAP